MKRLKLNKETVRSLQDSELAMIRGGDGDTGMLLKSKHRHLRMVGGQEFQLGSVRVTAVRCACASTCTDAGASWAEEGGAIAVGEQPRQSAYGW